VKNTGSETPAVEMTRQAWSMSDPGRVAARTPSGTAIAMELGCAGVLMNTAIAAAKDPVRMAGAMKLAVEAGREAFLAGRMPRKLYAASPSSPTTGLIG